MMMQCGWLIIVLDICYDTGWGSSSRRMGWIGRGRDWGAQYYLNNVELLEVFYLNKLGINLYLLIFKVATQQYSKQYINYHQQSITSTKHQTKSVCCLYHSFISIKRFILSNTKPLRKLQIRNKNANKILRKRVWTAKQSKIAYQRSDLLELRMAFDSFDIDQSGVIDPKAIINALKQFGYSADNRFVHQILAELDDDQPGGIPQDKLIKIILSHSNLFQSDSCICTCSYGCVWVYFVIHLNILLKFISMKDKYAYSPKQSKNTNHYDLNFKKSPQKYVLYESPKQPQDLPTNQYSPTSNFKEFDNLKKVTEETASLRQTMNNKFMSRIQKNRLAEPQQEKPNKLNDFLRQTMNHKSHKTYSDTLIPDYGYSSELYQDKYNNKYNQTSHLQHQRKIDIDEASSLKEYEKLNDKINRNKQIIQQLRKANKDPRQGKDLLKNVNHHRSPTFLHLDYKNQKEAPTTKASKQQSSTYFLTPKIDKGNYETRFNSSPFIEFKKDRNNEEQQTISSLTIIPTHKKKISSVGTIQKGLIDEFMIDKKLGQGKFGCVNLVRHKKTKGLFALKKIPKALIKSNMMVDQLALQIRIQSCIKNSNILEMFGFFDDKTHLYIVLEYMNGGTLYEKLKKEKIKEDQVSTIIRQITSAIDYLHDIGIAHRDIKPENIVISNNVYKICDFGWAAICTERRKTYCGTFDYVAPQILQGVEYDMTVDLWCLGVLTYQLLTGKAPFYHISRKETMKKILNVQNQILVFPQGMSEKAKDFIDKLIRKNPAERIKASEALLHPFLEEKEDDR